MTLQFQTLKPVNHVVLPSTAYVVVCSEQYSPVDKNTGGCPSEGGPSSSFKCLGPLGASSSRFLQEVVPLTVHFCEAYRRP